MVNKVQILSKYCLIQNEYFQFGCFDKIEEILKYIVNCKILKEVFFPIY